MIPFQRPRSVWTRPIHTVPLPPQDGATDAIAARVGLDPAVVRSLGIRAPTLRMMVALATLARALDAPDARPPSYRQLADMLGLKSLRSVLETYHSLRRRRLVAADQQPGETQARHRSLSVTEAGYRLLAAWTPPEGLEHVRGS